MDNSTLRSLLTVLPDVIVTESQVEQGFPLSDGVLVRLRARYLCSCSRALKVIAWDWRI
jgi:hypothetical protein